MRTADEDSFRAFATGQAPTLRRTAFLFCGDWHLAEDLMQAALVKIYRSWSRVQKRESLTNYARTVLLRTWLDERRRPFRRSELSGAELPDVPEPAGDPAVRVWAKELVHRALLELPPGQRAVLVLRYFDDLSVAETARVMRCAEGTVKSQSARGLDALRAVVARLAPASGGLHRE
ncbi:MAG TPA: SigE family RNA polymerase sigma factor [Actinophytocola sp.]|uniref:RNA polymerase sigma factor n=1 Tax=Actinophytocola sp. TaxID=1872138 RepID=UPI002DC03D40|nr:SigE family RNA polymerase sigma factor [Actinophytocola sp.]HEU5474051.1 SigE family RNA polymerase sigma factor [Actinophytocola sp.]